MLLSLSAPDSRSFVGLSIGGYFLLRTITASTVRSMGHFGENRRLVSVVQTPKNHQNNRYTCLNEQCSSRNFVDRMEHFKTLGSDLQPTRIVHAGESQNTAVQCTEHGYNHTDSYQNSSEITHEQLRDFGSKIKISAVNIGFNFFQRKDAIDCKIE